MDECEKYFIRKVDNCVHIKKKRLNKRLENDNIVFYLICRTFSSASLPRRFLFSAISNVQASTLLGIIKNAFIDYVCCFFRHLFHFCYRRHHWELSFSISFPALTFHHFFFVRSRFFSFILLCFFSYVFLPFLANEYYFSIFVSLSIYLILLISIYLSISFF